MGKFSSQFPVHLICRNGQLGNKWQRTKIFVFNNVFPENKFLIFKNMLKNVRKILLFEQHITNKSRKE